MNPARFMLMAVILVLLGGALLQARGGGAPVASPTSATPPPAAPSSPGARVQERSVLYVNDPLMDGERALTRYLAEGKAEDLAAAREAFDKMAPTSPAAPLYRAYVRDLAGDAAGRDALLKERRLDPVVYDFYFRDKAKVQQVMAAHMVDQCSRRMEAVRQALAAWRSEKTTWPEALQSLIPDYLEKLTACPVTGEGSYDYKTSPRGFELVCHQHGFDIVATALQPARPERNPVDGVLGYIQLAQGFYQAEREDWIEPILKPSGLGPGQVAADIGCGVGYFTFPMARVVGPKGRVYAVDINPSVLEFVKFAAERQQGLEVETVLSRPRDVMLPEESVDAAFMIQMYHVLVNHDRPDDPAEYDRQIKPILESIAKSLKSGGRLVITDTEPVRAEDRAHVPAEVVVDQVQRAGYRLVSRSKFGQAEYVLVFTR